MILLNDIPKRFVDDLIDATEKQSAIAQLARATRVERGGNIMQLSLGVEPASIVAGTDYSELPGEGEIKPVAGNSDMVSLQSYKFAQIIVVSQEYMEDMPRLYDEIIRQAPASIARGVDATALTSTKSYANFATFNTSNVYAKNVYDAEKSTYENLTAAFKGVNGVANGIIASPGFAVDLMTTTAQDGRPVFGTGIDGVSRVFGARVVQSDLLGSNNEPNKPFAVVGDWSKSVLGLRDDITLKILEEATVTLSDGSTVSLGQQNLIGILVEGWAGFMAAPGAFTRLGGFSVSE